MALRLRGATSGYIELKAPASAGDNTLTLPTNNGSANQLLKTDGSGNLSWTDDNSGVSLSGSTNNTIATVTGANGLQGESTLLWSGNALSTYRDNATTYGPGILGHHQRGTIASPSISQTDDTILNIVAKAFDGNDYHDAARIDFVVGAGTPGNNDMPGSIVFKTTDDGQGSSATRVTIQQNGNLLLDSSCSLVIHDGILHHGDTNTQIRFPANDTFTVETAGTERIRIDSDGRLRIGNTTQNQYTSADDLVIGSGSGDRGLTIYSGSSDGGVIAFSDGTTDTAYRSGQIVYDHSANSMDFRTNGNYIRLAIKDNGDFGVGLTTPTAQSGRVFHLHSGAHQQRFHMTNATTGSSATDGFEIIVEEGTNVRIRNFEAGALMFDSGGANNEAMRIDSSGRILIGATTSYANASIDELQIGNNNSSNQSGITIGSTDECAIAFADAGDARAGSITYNHGQDAMIIKTVGQNERFRITSNGSLQHSGGGTWASAKTTGDFKITVSNLTANAGNTWRKCGVFVMYSGINADATNSKSAVGYYGVGSVTNWSWFATGEDEEFTADSLTVTLDNDTTTSFRLNFNVADNNTGSINVFVNGDSTKPIIDIAA